VWGGGLKVSLPPMQFLLKATFPPIFLARLMDGFERVHEHDYSLSTLTLALKPHQNGRDSDESTNDIVDCRQAFLQRYSTDVE